MSNNKVFYPFQNQIPNGIFFHHQFMAAAGETGQNAVRCLKAEITLSLTSDNRIGYRRTMAYPADRKAAQRI